LVFFMLVTNFFWGLQPLQTQNSKHSIMLWCDAGYSTFFTKWDSFKNTGNMGAGIGLGYHITAWNHFTFSAGFQYLSLNSSIRPVNFTILKNLIDTEGDEYIMNYSLQKFVQIDRTHNVFIPIYLGFITDLKTANFFIQAGGKIGYMFAANYSSKVSSFKTSGIYDPYIDPFENMPNHYFDTKKYSRNAPLKLNKLQAVASLEFGVEIPSVIADNSIRIGFFADYGWLNRQSAEMKKHTKELIVFETIPNEIQINSLYETNQKKSLTTTTFFAGVKITLLLDVIKPPCLNCLPKKRTSK